MSEGSTAQGSRADGPRAFRLIYMFHPSVHVLDLAETEQWYERVFGASSIRLSTAPQDPDNRNDYSTFTMIRDVLMDSIDPKLFIKEGRQQYATVDEPHLKGFGWYADGLSELYRAHRRADILVVGLLGVQGTDDEPPMALQSSTAMFFTVPQDIGLRYQYLAPMPMAFDPRMKEGWELGPRPDDDPLGIDFTSHHTILTDRPERALRLLVDVLGGEVLDEGRNEALGTSSTYLRLADGAHEIAVPDPGSPAHADLATTLPNDCYHSITFKVADLDNTRRHLEAQGVALRADTGSMIVTDPKTSQGIPWGFTEEALVGDDRG
jgi:catechol 2,3-dioxygenase-like lactoylglutathione lyase family enzyme